MGCFSQSVAAEEMPAKEPQKLKICYSKGSLQAVAAQALIQILPHEHIDLGLNRRLVKPISTSSWSTRNKTRSVFLPRNHHLLV